MSRFCILIFSCNLLFLFACKTTKKPHSNTLNLNDYYQQRNALLKKDSLLYFDNAERLSVKEERLNRQLIQLQKEMIQQYKADHFFPPARNFYASKEHIENTKLFQLLKKMPKGGILHLHSGAMGNAQWVVDKAIALPEMYVYWEKDNDKYVKGQLHAYEKGKAPEGFQIARTLADQNKNFTKELFALLTFDKAMDRDSIDIWGEFEKVFQRINGFITYKKIAADYLIHGIDILINDNIQHAEFRTFFGPRYYELDGMVVDVRENDELFRKVEKMAKQKDPDFTFNLLQQSLRFFDKKTIWEHIQLAHQYRQEFPHWIRGFDLVAEEDAGHTTLFHVPLFLKLDSLERATGVELPLYLHDGESDWISNANLYDAVLLGTKRIGHGFNLFRFPHLIELVKEKDICVEVNPLSNQILGYIRDLRLHPASTYLRRGVNCVISSDDPLIFDYEGLTYDFWSVFLAWELDLAALKKLSRNSIEYAAMTDEEKEKALKVWKKRWKQFVEQTDSLSLK